MVGATRRQRKSRQNADEFCSGASILPNPNLFSKQIVLTNEERTGCVLSTACACGRTLPTARACGNSAQSLRKESLAVTLATTTAPLSPRATRRAVRQNHFLFNLLFGSSSDPSTEKERKVRKWFCRTGSLRVLLLKFF